MLFTNYPGVYGKEHILYLIIVIIFFALSIFFIKKYAKDEKTKTLIIKIGALVLLAFILTNRISVTYYDVVINKRENYTWLSILPHTWCGMSSLVLALALLLGKKDNAVLHSICYIAALGGFLTTLYPDFLESQTFFDIRSITGLLHHLISLWLVVICIITSYFVPSLKKWYYYPIGMMMILTFGIFEIDALNFSKAMQIKEPLLKSLPHLTSWYVVGVVSVLLQVLFLFIFEHLKKNKELIKAKEKGE